MRSNSVWELGRTRHLPRNSELHEIRIEELLRQVVVDEARYVAGDRVQFYLRSPVDEDRQFLADPVVDVRVGGVLEQPARCLAVGVREANQVAL